MATPHGLAAHKNYRICLYGATAKTSGVASVAPFESVNFKLEPLGRGENSY
jgi:hypothetical protein